MKNVSFKKVALVLSLIAFSLIVCAGLLIGQSINTAKNVTIIAGNPNDSKSNIIFDKQSAQAGSQAIINQPKQSLVPKKEPVETTRLAQTAADLAFDEYEKYETELKQLVISQDPTVALRKLNSDIHTVKSAQEYCHSLTHAIGNAALDKYENSVEKSLAYNVDICGGGYVHGIIEEYLEKNSNAEKEIITICKKASDGTCFHAIGHGLMLIYKMDIDKSVQACKRLSNFTKELWCGEGVFMENFDSENVSDAKKPFLKSDDPIYPCSNYSDPYSDACYYYSGRYIFKQNKDDPKAALQKCITVKINSGTCIRGMSAGILRADLLNPNIMEDYCNSVPKYKSNCLQGAVNYHLFMFGNNDKTKTEMCNKFIDITNKNTCINLIAQSPFKN